MKDRGDAGGCGHVRRRRRVRRSLGCESKAGVGAEEIEGGVSRGRSGGRMGMDAETLLDPLSVLNHFVRNLNDAHEDAARSFAGGEEW